MFKFQTIFAVCLIAFTSLLVTKTLQIQHSCQPMIYSGTLPAECQEVATKEVATKEVATKEVATKEVATKEVATKDVSNTRDREKSYLENQTDNKPKSDNSAIEEQPHITQNISQPEPNNISSNFQVYNSEISLKNDNPKSETQSNPITKFVNEHPDDIVGGVAGIAGGIATVAAAGATAAFSVPIAGAVAIGLGIWFLIRSVF
ncbi:MAG: hypothetical protein QNJ53_06765 [Pleurocapsa sp. MO_192.B19]|nr:hypothetical protein [Pleurocapsa sp. MO_192.B19]